MIDRCPSCWHPLNDEGDPVCQQRDPMPWPSWPRRPLAAPPRSWPAPVGQRQVRAFTGVFGTPLWEFVTPRGTAVTRSEAQALYTWHLWRQR